jgi:hypothetical protein
MAQQHHDFPDAPADDRVRQGRIVLNTPVRRAVFFGALILLGLICLAAALVAAF